MEIKDGRISILCGEDCVEISLHDSDASITFANVKMKPEQFCQALSRLIHTKCEKMEVNGLEKVGKKMEHREIVFPINGKYRDKGAALAVVDKYCPAGWVASRYFGSQGSFFTRDGKEYARTTIRRWV